MKKRKESMGWLTVCLFSKAIWEGLSWVQFMHWIELKFEIYKCSNILLVSIKGMKVFLLGLQKMIFEKHELSHVFFLLFSRFCGIYVDHTSYLMVNDFYSILSIYIFISLLFLDCSEKDFFHTVTLWLRTSFV